MYTLSSQAGPLTTVERNAVIEEFWASRNAWAEAMNAERRQAWERKWVGLSERDLAPGHTRAVQAEEQEVRSEPRIFSIRRRRDEQPEGEAGTLLQPHRAYWQTPATGDVLGEAAS